MGSPERYKMVWVGQLITGKSNVLSTFLSYFVFGVPLPCQCGISGRGRVIADPIIA